MQRDLKLLKLTAFLLEKNEQRKIEEIQPEELNRYVSEWGGWIKVCKSADPCYFLARSVNPTLFCSNPDPHCSKTFRGLNLLHIGIYICFRFLLQYLDFAGKGLYFLMFQKKKHYSITKWINTFTSCSAVATTSGPRYSEVFVKAS